MFAEAKLKERSGHYAEREERTAGVGAGILVSEANKKSPRTLNRLVDRQRAERARGMW